MIELKPCPFCGEAPVMRHVSDSLFDCGIFAYYVTCPKCGVRTQKDRDESKPIETWNRRAKNDRNN